MPTLPILYIIKLIGTIYHESKGYKVHECVVPENIHTPTTEGIENSRGVGGSMAQEIPEGRRGEWLDKFPEGQLHVHVRHNCSKL